MDRFSIKEIELLTGIKAHTLRIWEKRYGIIKPFRTNTNIRYFTDEQLRKILSISTLNKAGLKISKIAELTESDIAREIIKLTDQNDPNVYFDRFTVCMYDFDATTFNDIFNECVGKMGLQATVLDIIFPFMNHIGVMWGNNEISPANEHFISNMVREKILGAIDDLPNISDQSKPVVLFLPQHESHELGLIFAYYQLKSNGVKTIYLGSNVPDQSLKNAVDQLKPRGLVTSFFKRSGNNELLSQLQTWSSWDKQMSVCFAGVRSEVELESLPANCHYLSSINDLDEKFPKF